jgi:hypothetical protein
LDLIDCVRFVVESTNENLFFSRELYEDYAILRDVESQQLFCSLVNGLQFLDFEIPYRTISDVKQVVDRVQKSMSQDREEFNNVQESSHARPSRKRNKVPIQ